jgi:cyclohexadienyl dehydratase
MRLLLLLAVLLLPAGSRAQSRLDDIATAGVLRAGMTGDYQPFSVRDKTTGEYSGLDVDMARNLAAALGVKLEIVPTTWSNLMTDLTGAVFDIGMGGISVTLQRQKQAFFSAPVLRAGKAAIARCFERDRFLSLAAIDQPGVKVIVNPGGTNETFGRANLRRAEIVVYPDNTKIFGALAAGEANVMITDVFEAKVQQTLHRDLCAIHPDQPFDFGELAYLLPRDIALKLFVDEWLHELKESGALEQMKIKHLGR